MVAAAAVGGTEGAEGACAAAGAAGAKCAGVALPRVVIGCWQLLERQKKPEKAVQMLMDYAEAGFLAFDTADIYGPSEAILGTLRSRWAVVHPEGPPLRFFTKYVTEDTSEEEAVRVNAVSLKNLGVTSLDMVQFHFWSLAPDGSDHAYLKAARQLLKLQQAGKIRHLAGCNMDTVHMRGLLDSGLELVANQVQYSLLDRRPEVRLLAFCKERGIQLTVYGAVAGGLLSDSFLGLAAPDAERQLNTVSRRMYWSSLQRWTKDWSLFQRLLQTLRDIGLRKSPPLSVALVASAWVLHQLEALGAGGALIIGVRDARHLEEHRLLLSGAAALDAADAAAVAQVLAQGRAPSSDAWSHERGWA